MLDLRLFAVNAVLEDMPEGGGLSYHFDSDVKVQHMEQRGTLVVLGDYDLRVTSVDDSEAKTPLAGDRDRDEEGDEDSSLATIKFQMSALFSVEEPADEPLTEDELDAFAQTTGQFALYPYARQFIYDLTGRMGLPPLHLGILRIRLDKRNED